MEADTPVALAEDVLPAFRVINFMQKCVALSGLERF